MLILLRLCKPLFASRRRPTTSTCSCVWPSSSSTGRMWRSNSLPLTKCCSTSATSPCTWMESWCYARYCSKCSVVFWHVTIVLVAPFRHMCALTLNTQWLWAALQRSQSSVSKMHGSSSESCPQGPRGAKWDAASPFGGFMICILAAESEPASSRVWMLC